MMKKRALLLGLLTICLSCGKKNNSKVSSSIVIQENSDSNNVLPSFEKYANEFKTFEMQGKLFDKKGLRYNRVVVSRNPRFKNLNYQTFDKGLRTVEIYGKEIVLGEEANQDFYKLINNAIDIRKLIIHAEKLVVTDPVIVHGADITIKVKDLFFEGFGSIKTTPISLNHRAEKFQDGLDGLNAGPVNLYVEKYYTDNDEIPRFITDGGNGQPAGPGEHGTVGTNAKIVRGSNGHIYEYQICHNDGHAADRHKNMAIDCYWKKGASGRAAGNGGDAKVGGKPGAPGNAGFVKLYNHSVKIAFSASGGKPGAQDEYRTGGKPGYPARTCRIMVSKWGKEKSEACVTAVEGKGVEAKQAQTQLGKGHEAVVYSQLEASWMNLEYIQAEFLYINDLYLSGNHWGALNFLNQLEKNLKKISLSLDEYAMMDQLELELKDLKNKIDMHLDYFGHPKAWTPNLAFEMSFSLFKNEVNRNIKMLYFADLIRTNMNKNMIKLSDVKSLQESLFENIEENSKQINGLIGQMALTDELINDLSVSEDEFQFELALLEQEIRKKAKNNLKVPFMDKAVSIFAAASKVIPVAQPTLAAVGTGLEFIHNATKGRQSSTELLQGFASLAQSFKDADFKTSLKDINRKLDSLSPRHIPEFKTMKERLEYFNKVKDFTAPIITTVSSELAKFRDREVSKSALDLEIEKIKTKHKMYHRVVETLNNLLMKKLYFKDHINQMMQQMSEVSTQITEDYLNVSYLFDDISKLIHVDVKKMALAMNEIYNQSVKRINYYEYLLKKTFFYRLMNSNNTEKIISLDIENMLKKIKNDSASSTEQNLESLWLEYNNNISDYISTVLQETMDSNLNKVLTKEIYLNDAELEMLNKGEAIYIDLTSKKLWGENKEDVRIEDIQAFENVNFKSDHREDFEVIFSHDGQGLIEKNGEDYFFAINGNERNLQFAWTSSFNMRSGNVYHSESSSKDESMLTQMLATSSISPMAFSNPAARAFIKVEIHKPAQMIIENLAFKINYSFRHK